MTPGRATWDDLFEEAKPEAARWPKPEELPCPEGFSRCPGPDPEASPKNKCPACRVLSLKEHLDDCAGCRARTEAHLLGDD